MKNRPPSERGEKRPQTYAAAAGRIGHDSLNARLVATETAADSASTDFQEKPLWGVERPQRRGASVLTAWVTSQAWIQVSPSAVWRSSQQTSRRPEPPRT